MTANPLFFAFHGSLIALAFIVSPWFAALSICFVFLAAWWERGRA